MINEIIEIIKKRRYYGSTIPVGMVDRVKKDILWDIQQYFKNNPTDAEAVVAEVFELYPEWDGHKDSVENWCHSFRGSKDGKEQVIALRPRCKHYPKAMEILKSHKIDDLIGET